MQTNENLCLVTPLYEAFEVTSFVPILSLEYFNGPLDAYCNKCGQSSVFLGIQRNPPPNAYASDLDTKTNSRPLITYQSTYLDQNGIKDRTFSLSFVCSRASYPGHLMYFVFAVIDGKLMKIGQYPSIADLQSAETTRYKKVLGKHFIEFSKSVGLASHGVGIGAFIYLRRIFERLIEEAHHLAKSDATWVEDIYEKSRMNDKIVLLKDHLPSFLIQNRSLYSILSKGVHELTEQECLEYFNPVRIAIELILDEKIEAQKKISKIEEANKAISNITKKIG